MGYLTVAQTYDPVDNVYEPINENENKNKNHKNHKNKICYYSDINGCFIVDAITGAKFPWKVGTFDESRFFRVIDTLHGDNKNNSSGKAFYENPHAYMRHKHVELDDKLVSDWYERHETLYSNEYIDE
jgi:hypothetical protein